MGGMKQRNTGRSLRDLKREISARSESNQEKKPQVVQEEDDSWYPSSYTAWKLVLSARLCAAVWSGVSDCDETYNYWEPTHNLLYGQGMQTWEYDPRYALRSYMYLMIHAVPGWIYSKLLQPNPMLVFYFLRCLLGGICASCEVYFYQGVVKEFGINVGRITLTILTLSTGMFISSTAYLPSSTSMYLTLLAYGAWFRQEYRAAIFATALSAILSWPFTVLLGVPIAIDTVVYRGKVNMFLGWSAISAVTILGPIMMCDTFYYGKPVFASFNIIMYNVFTSHGPDLYGTEPASFYLINGILNFNLVFPAALLLVLVRVGGRLLLGEKTVSLQGEHLPILLSQAGLYLWFLVFWLQPHKEERFIFPVYPLIALAGAISIDTTQRIIHSLLSTSKQYLNHTLWISGSSLLLFGIISLLRITALYQHYQGSTDVWMNVAQLEVSQHTTHVCVGKEWYRFPSSFFLPSTSFKIEFLKSEFRGQLPKYYGSTEKGLLPTRVYHDDFNDQNMEEPSRYFTNPGKCHYLVDLDNDEVTDRQPRYAGHENWTEVSSFSFLDSGASHPFFRAFYIPFIDSYFCKYNKYLLLKRNLVHDKN